MLDKMLKERALQAEEARARHEAGIVDEQQVCF